MTLEITVVMLPTVLASIPVITKTPRSVDTVDGKSITFVCSADGVPKPRIKWTKNSGELSGGRYSTTDSGDLLISQVDLTDSGYYTCIASNTFGTANATGKLNVKERTQIISKPEDKQVVAGAKTTFRCRATADSSLHLTVGWSIDDVPIRFDGEPRLSKGDDFSLTITDIVESDSGTYACLAKTELDSASAGARLIIQDRPNKPQLLGIACGSRNAVIKWQPSGDNRAPILHYTIEYNTSFAPNTWSVASSDVPATDRTHNVSMMPWANYTFRVIATNRVGRSVPSLHSRACSSQPDVPYSDPENVKVAGTEPTNLVIGWTPMPKIRHNAPGLGYRVYWKRDERGQVWNSEEVANYTDRELIVNDQPSYQCYKVKVVAFNDVGESRVLKKEVVGYSGEGVPIDAPQNLTVLNVTGSRSAILSWEPVSPESIKGNFMGYKIQFWNKMNGEKNMTEEKVHPNSTRVEIKNLSPISINYVHILAYNSRFNGPTSQPVHFNTLGETDGDIDEGSDGEMCEPLITTANLGLYIVPLLFLLLVVILFVGKCVIRRKTRSKHFVIKSADMSDPHYASGEPHFNESFKPLVEANRSENEKASEQNDTISMKELDEGNLEGMTEDGSFIGVYILPV